MAEAAGAVRWRSSPVVMRRWLSSELVRLRAAADLTQRDVASELGCSVAKVSYLESGDRAVSPRELEEVLLELYDVPLEERDRYLDAAEVANQQGWWDRWGDEDLPRAQRRYLGIEDGATRLRAFLPSIIHGLFQTSSYTKEILRAYETLPEERISRLVELRKARQAVLTHPTDPLKVHLLIDQAAIDRQVGSWETMRAQLVHISDLADDRENVTVQVLPFESGAHGAYYGPFTILEFPWEDDPGLVYIEGLIDERYLEARSNVYEYSRLFEQLTRRALTPADSVAMLRARAGRVEQAGREAR